MNAFIIHSVLVILILLSVVTWTVAVVKIKQFKRTQQECKSFEDRFWQAKSWHEGQTMANQDSSYLAQIAQIGFMEYAEYRNNPDTLKYAGDVHEILERPLKQEIQTS